MNLEIQARPRSSKSGLFRRPCPRLDSDLKLSENQRDLPTTWLVNIKGLASEGYTSEYQAHYITTYRDCGQKWKRILSLFSIYHNGLKTFLKYRFTLFTPLNFKQVPILKIVSCTKGCQISDFYVHRDWNLCRKIRYKMCNQKDTTDVRKLARRKLTIPFYYVNTKV